MSFDFAAARQLMVESQVRPADVTDYGITDAMRAVERERLCPPDKLALAYADSEVPYGGGRALMRPRDAGKLLQAVRPRRGERVLAVAAPYLAAVMEAMGLQVTRLEGGDLSSPPKGDFDVVVSEGAVSAVPPAWLEALAPGGRLGVVERIGPVGKARVYMRGEAGVGRREAFDASPHFLPGFEPRQQFAF
jgi:protein-L-isoaspartate(D-aspartate) O-methyltransferase